MLAATMSPWYSPMCVSGQRPLTSPIADSLESDVVHPRTSSRCYEQPIAPEITTIVELEDIVLAVAPCAGCLHAESQFDADATQRFAERLPQRRRFAGEYAL